MSRVCTCESSFRSSLISRSISPARTNCKRTQLASFFLTLGSDRNYSNVDSYCIGLVNKSMGEFFNVTVCSKIALTYWAIHYHYQNVRINIFKWIY